MKTHTEPEKKEEMSSQCLYCDSNFEHCQYPQWNLKVHVKEKHPKDYNPMNFSLDKSRSESYNPRDTESNRNLWVGTKRRQSTYMGPKIGGSPRMFDCPYCETSMSQKINLKTHIKRLHTGKRNFYF